MFTGTTQERNHCYMNEQTVFPAYFQRNLTYRFNKRLRLNIANGSTNFSNYYISIGLLAYTVNEFFNFIGDVRNNLHRRAKIFTASFFVQHIPVNLAGSKIGIFIKFFINKAFIMTQVKVSFGAIFGYINFPVLIRAHGTRVNVNIGIQFLGGNL